jgi:hypothetical protein
VILRWFGAGFGSCLLTASTVPVSAPTELRNLAKRDQRALNAVAEGVLRRLIFFLSVFRATLRLLPQATVRKAHHRF